MQASVAIAALLRRQIIQSRSLSGPSIGSLGLIAIQRSRYPDQPTSPGDAHLVGRHYMAHRITPSLWAHQDQTKTFPSTEISRWASASRRLSLLFSISRAFYRWASDTDMPPNLDFQL